MHLLWKKLIGPAERTPLAALKEKCLYSPPRLFHPAYGAGAVALTFWRRPNILLDLVAIRV